MQIVSIQALRAFAALIVAFGHAQAFIAIPMERLNQPFAWSYLLPWGAGVDLFFVISGFIMVYSSEKLFATPDGQRAFMWRRISRIAPLYWIITGVAIAKIYLQHKGALDLPSIVASLLFIPYSAVGAEAPRPIYELGWTLNYEMFFYVLFAFTIRFRRNVAASIAIAMLAAFALVGWLFPQSSPQLFVWTQAIILEFACGVALALLARRQVALPAFLRAALVAAGLAALLYDGLGSSAQPHVWVTPNDLSRVIFWGLPAAAIFAGCVLGPQGRFGSSVFGRMGGKLGDASYALYLSHPMVLSAFSAFWFKSGLDRHLSPWLAVWTSVALSIVASLVVYRWFERPITEYLQGASGRSRQNGHAAAPAAAGEPRS